MSQSDNNNNHPSGSTHDDTTSYVQDGMPAAEVAITIKPSFTGTSGGYHASDGFSRHTTFGDDDEEAKSESFKRPSCLYDTYASCYEFLKDVLCVYVFVQLISLP